MGDMAINNICLIHKIALVWNISRNIFQPLDYASSLVMQLKKFFFHFSESLYNCQCHNKGKYSTSNVIATHFSQVDNKNDRNLDYI